jgi:hypothetical protein
MRIIGALRRDVNRGEIVAEPMRYRLHLHPSNAAAAVDRPGMPRPHEWAILGETTRPEGDAMSLQELEVAVSKLPADARRAAISSTVTELAASPWEIGHRPPHTRAPLAAADA